jgi:FlaA1/EpsC-like NDP-sugar epimerase
VRAPRLKRLHLTSLASDLLPLFDFLCVLLAAQLSTLVYGSWLAASGPALVYGEDFGKVVLAVAVLAIFLLYDRRFGSNLGQEHRGLLIRGFALRVALLTGLVLAVGAVGNSLQSFPAWWLALWFGTSLLLTSFTRVLAAGSVWRLQHQTTAKEVIAVVGTGLEAYRLVLALQQLPPGTVDLLGIFEDQDSHDDRYTIKATGTLAQLLELGQFGRIDWIVLALPPTSERAVLSIVQQLKVLSVPIGLSPTHIGLGAPFRTVDSVGDRLLISESADGPMQRWESLIRGGHWLGSDTQRGAGDGHTPSSPPHSIRTRAPQGQVGQAP